MITRHHILGRWCDATKKELLLRAAHVPDRFGMRYPVAGRRGGESPSLATRRKKVVLYPPVVGERSSPLLRQRLWYSTYKIYITRSSGFASLKGKGHDTPPSDTKQLFCVATKLWTQKLNFDTNATPEALVEEFVSFHQTNRLR